MVEYLSVTKKFISGDNYTIVARQDLADRPLFTVCENSVTNLGFGVIHDTFNNLDDALLYQARLHKEEDDYYNSFNTKEELV